MQLPIFCMLLLWEANFSCGQDTIDELFDIWNLAKANTQSLIVEFDLETINQTFGDRTRSSGTVRLLRTSDGVVFGICETVKKGTMDGEKWLFQGNTVYLLDQTTKTFNRIQIRDDEMIKFLEALICPFFVLLDRERANDRHKFEIFKQDELQTYLKLCSKRIHKPNRFTSFHDWLYPTGRFPENCEIVLMRNDSPTIPRGMPSYLQYTVDKTQLRYKVKSWRMNVFDGPKLEDFRSPETVKGWSNYDALQFKPKRNLTPK